VPRAAPLRCSSCAVDVGCLVISIPSPYPVDTLTVQKLSVYGCALCTAWPCAEEVHADRSLYADIVTDIVGY